MGKTEDTAMQIARNALERIYVERVMAPNSRGRVLVCDEWKETPDAFVEWALESGWRMGMGVARYNADDKWSPGNCRCCKVDKNGHCRTDTGFTWKWLKDWRNQQRQAAIKWLHMPEETTVEEFIAELGRLGLLSEPRETENGMEE